MPQNVKHIPLKRIFDLLFSIHIILLFSPLFLLIAIIIKLSSPGKIFYRHQRVGRGGKKFYCLKFRTMYKDADEKLIEILKNDHEKKLEWEQTHKLKIDPRITPIGKFLRKTSLDELPQFWNVIKGDLSVVGPRPVVQEELTKFFGEKAEKILSVRPGITGMWQVSGRNDISYKKRIKLDEIYIDHRTMLLDIKLIAKTIPLVIFSRGAY